MTPTTSQIFSNSEHAPTLAQRLRGVRDAVGQASLRAGLAEPVVIAVTKFHPPELVRDLLSLGVGDIGESRHPEAERKRDAVRSFFPERAELHEPTWHFIGQIQTNKAKRIARYADCIHTFDRPELIDACAAVDRERPIDAFVQVNLTEDPNRGGCQPEAVLALADRVAAEDALRLRGVMAVAPRGEEPERAFAKVAELSETIERHHPAATARSIGMSGDFIEAIKYGATHLRIGVAITGERPVQT